MEFNHPVGVASALTAAALWATVSFVYQHLGANIRPLALNFLKGCAGLLFMAPFLAWRGTLYVDLPAWPLVLLIFGGMIGIGLGDTALFAALNRIGTRRTLLVAETLAPVFTVVLGWLLVGERLSPAVLLGLAVVIAGVVVALLPDGGRRLSDLFTWNAGFACAVVSALCQATGVVLSAMVFDQYEVDAAWTAFVRLLAGTAVLLLFAPAMPERFKLPHLRSTRVWLTIAGCSLFGTAIGLVLLQVAVKNTFSGVAQTLISTSVLFALIISAVAGERIPPQGWWGTLLAVVGVGLLCWSTG